MLPSKDKLNICFAHGAYQMAARFAARGTGIAHFQVWKPDEYAARVAEADVVVASMMWRNDLVPQAKRLKFVQSISAGIDQYDQKVMREHGIRLANAAGVNANAVAEHAMALILALKRHIHTGRDNQAAKFWRGMISDIPAREDELGGKTLLVVGLGRIGSRLAKLAKAFDLKVVATRRDASRGGEGADAVYGHERLAELLPDRRHGGAHLPADAPDHQPDRCQGARPDEADRAPHQRGARARRRRGRPDPRPAGEAHCRRRPRRHARGAAAGRISALGDEKRPDHARTPPARPSATRTASSTCCSRTSTASGAARRRSRTRSSEACSPSPHASSAWGEGTGTRRHSVTSPSARPTSPAGSCSRQGIWHRVRRTRARRT